MKALRAWLATLIEFAFLGVGLGCLGTYGYATMEARWLQNEQRAQFEREAAAKAQYVAAPGSLVGMLDVPRLRMSLPVIEGDDDRTLKASVGHLPDTPMPWQPGNSAMAGHRDGLFRPLKGVAIGDEITFRTTREAIRYRVTATAIVEPDDIGVLAPRPRDALTLITCYPFSFIGPAPQRFIVHAERVSPAPGTVAARSAR
jgi:LPXTG-site transpeptidase (sortase) family protein